MQQMLASIGLLVALALAGCSGGDDDGPRYEAVTCPDGTMMTGVALKGTIVKLGGK